MINYAIYLITDQISHSFNCGNLDCQIMQGVAQWSLSWNLEFGPFMGISSAWSRLIYSMILMCLRQKKKKKGSGFCYCSILVHSLILYFHFFSVVYFFIFIVVNKHTLLGYDHPYLQHQLRLDQLWMIDPSNQA